MRQLTREEAIALGETRFWESLTYRERAWLQLNQDRLCMPFEVYHEAVTEAVGRSVWNVELGMNRDRLKAELLAPV